MLRLVTTVFDAVVLEDYLYPSGLQCLMAGDRVKVTVTNGSIAVRRDELYERPAVASAGHDQDWVWRHLVIECPWTESLDDK